LQFCERQPRLLLRIHHDGAVPCDGFLKRLSRDEQESDSVLPCLHRDFVAAIKEYERKVICFHRRSCVQLRNRFRRYSEWARRITRFSASRKNMDKGMTRRLDGKGFPFTRRNRYINADRICGDSFYRTGLSPETPADHSNVSAIITSLVGLTCLSPVRKTYHFRRECYAHCRVVCRNERFTNFHKRERPLRARVSHRRCTKTR
jgi:hypothetical protein